MALNVRLFPNQYQHLLFPPVPPFCEVFEGGHVKGSPRNVSGFFSFSLSTSCLSSLDDFEL
jgi:hypothetical protein